MKNLVIISLLLFITSCSTIKHAVGGALGGGITAVFLPEPAMVAAGAAGGVMLTEVIMPSASPAAIAGQVLNAGPVQGSTASTLHETGGLIKTDLRLLVDDPLCVTSPLQKEWTQLV